MKKHYDIWWFFFFTLLLTPLPLLIAFIFNPIIILFIYAWVGLYLSLPILLGALIVKFKFKQIPFLKRLNRTGMTIAFICIVISSIAMMSRGTAEFPGNNLGSYAFILVSAFYFLFIWKKMGRLFLG